MFLAFPVLFIFLLPVLPFSFSLFSFLTPFLLEIDYHSEYILLNQIAQPATATRTETSIAAVTGSFAN